jgi:hypothetical protein
MPHNALPPLMKRMSAETEPVKAFRIYNRGIVERMQSFIRNKDWTGLNDFVEAINTETEPLSSALLIENKTSSRATA